MRAISLLLLILVTITLRHPEAQAYEETLQVDVRESERQQGQFFTVSVSPVPGQPQLWFMERNFTMFRQADSSWRALIPVENLTKPGGYAILIIAGSDEQKIPVQVHPNNRKIQNIRLDPTKKGISATETEKTRVKAALQIQTPEKLHSGVFLRPAPGRVSSLFGLKRSYNGGPVTSYHKGIDISAPQGTPVRSTAAGRVVLAGTVAEGFHLHGNTVVIDHGQGLTAIYMHLHTIGIKEEQIIEKGAVIGTVGHTGISTAPHLHWGTYLYGTSVDPLLFLDHEY